MEDKNHTFDGKEDRNYHQKPFDDVTDKLGQIDEASATIADKRQGTEEVPDENPAPLRNEINDTDVRDKSDSSKDWDAENSRTGRNK